MTPIDLPGELRTVRCLQTGEFAAEVTERYKHGVAPPVSRTKKWVVPLLSFQKMHTPLGCVTGHEDRAVRRAWTASRHRWRRRGKRPQGFSLPAIPQPNRLTVGFPTPKPPTAHPKSHATDLTTVPRAGPAHAGCS